MRVALISMADDGAASVRLGGRSLAFQQLAVALAAGCERVVCLADAPGSELAALQRAAEARGATFHAISHHRMLSGLVRAADAVLAFAPGMVPDAAWVTDKLAERSGVAILPESAVARGFERIDRDTAWAGVLAAPGDTVEALTQLPPDFDPLAGLLRIALQRGVRTIPVPSEWLDQRRWTLVPDQAAADTLEAGWYATRVPGPPLARPLAAGAHRLARRLMRRTADRPWLAPLTGIGGAVLVIAGGTAGLMGYTPGGLVAAALGTFGLATWRSLASFAQVGHGAKVRPLWAMLGNALADLALLAIAFGSDPAADWQAPFNAAVLACTVRLALEPAAPRPVRPWGDRALVLLSLAIAAALGVFAEAAAAIALMGLALRLLFPPVEITRA